MSFKPSYNKSSTNKPSTNKPSTNAFRTVNPKINPVPVLTAASFPSLSETTCAINTCNVDNSGKYNCACPKLYNGQNCNLCNSHLNKIYYPFCLRYFFN